MRKFKDCTLCDYQCIQVYKFMHMINMRIKMKYAFAKNIVISTWTVLAAMCTDAVRIMIFTTVKKLPVSYNGVFTDFVFLSDPTGISNVDTKFVLGFFGVNNNAIPPQPNANLYIATNDPRGAQVVIDTPNITLTGFPKTISIPPGVTETVSFPVNLGGEDIRVSDVVSSGNKAITVKSTNNARLSIIGVNDESRSTDGFLALPCKSYSPADGSVNIVEYKYFVFSSGTTTRFQSRILIIPCEEAVNDQVSIKQPGERVMNLENLQKYETFLFQRSRRPDPNDSSRTIPIDLTGTVIKSRTPLAVFVGHECGQVPSESTACDHLVEQIPPHAVYGQMFFPVPFALRESGDIFKIGSVSNDNEVTVTCTRRTADGSSSIVSSSATINEGEYHTHRTLARADVSGLTTDGYRRDFCCIETSEPAVVMQYMLGHSEDEVSIQGVNGQIGDPSMTLVPPVSQYSNDYIVNTFDDILDDDANMEYESYVSWAIASAFFEPNTPDEANFVVNDVTYTPPSRTMTGTGEYIPIRCKNGTICGYGAFGPLPAGSSTISYNSPRDPHATVYASVYGFQRENSYAYPAGFECTPLGCEFVHAHINKCAYQIINASR